jgi:NADPH-dependent 2,4-dienoyl-CoA reductase/sulfur reductase-like enzyme
VDRIVVVGGSLAGVEAAAALRREGFGGRLTVVGDEAGSPYERYPLSKAYLIEHLGPGDLALPVGLGADVDYRDATEAVGLDLSASCVVLGGGGRLPFDGLVIATGARPRRVPWAAGLSGVSSYRTQAEASVVRAALDDVPASVVVVGGGLIGSEIASAVTQLGLAVTIVDRSPLPLARSLGPVLAAHLVARHRASGVRVLTGTSVVATRVESGHIRGLLLDNGRILPADLVVVATGTVPNVDWLRSSGVDVDGGVRCGPTLHVAGSTTVVGAGDVVRTSYPLLGSETHRVEHWRHAMGQARCAAENLLAGPRRARPFDETPTYSTTIQGLAVRVAGFPQCGDESVVVRGSTETDSFVVAVGRRRRLVAMMTVNATAGEEAACRELVEASARTYVDLREVSGQDAPLAPTSVT